MEVTLRWLAQENPHQSFFTERLVDNVSSILDAPLPRSLQLDHPTRSLTPNRTASPSANHQTGGRYSLVAAKPIHDTLIEKGKLMVMKREALQEQALVDERKQLRDKPKVSEHVKSLAPRTEPIELRLLRKAQENSEREVFEIQQRKIHEKKVLENAAPFKPSISVKGKRAESKLSSEDFYQNWHRRREQRLEARRTETLLKEISEVRNGPDINARSARLAAAKREKEGLAGMSHVDAMLERERLTKLAAWERSQKELEAMANPQITVYAATLARDNMSASERLYARSFGAEERRYQRMKEQEMRDVSCSYSPRISKLAASVPRMFPVEDEIMQRHLEALAVRDERVRLEQERELESHHPAINPVSDAIASRLPVSAKERLVQPKSSYCDPYGIPERSQGRSISTTRSSSVSTAVSSGMSERLEAMASFAERKEANLQRLKEEKLQREMENCTFAPSTNRNSAAIAPSSNVLERNQQWHLRREMKLDEQRRQHEESELNGCTFAPERHPEMESSVERLARNESQTIYGGDGKPWGSQEFVERMQEARKIREEKEHRVQPSGNAWRPTITQPQEFQLGRTKTPVKSLKRPAEPNAVQLLSPNQRDERRAHSNAIVPPSLW